MQLETMSLAGNRAIIPDGQGQEMKLEIRVRYSVVATYEPTGFKMIGGAYPL